MSTGAGVPVGGESKSYTGDIEELRDWLDHVDRRLGSVEVSTSTIPEINARTKRLERNARWWRRVERLLIAALSALATWLGSRTVERERPARIEVPIERSE